MLADALTLADEEKPALLIDMATLTGAHRVALGADLPGVFTDDEALAAEVAAAGAAECDYSWRLPLWKPYGGCSCPARLCLPEGCSFTRFQKRFQKRLVLFHSVRRQESH